MPTEPSIPVSLIAWVVATVLPTAVAVTTRRIPLSYNLRNLAVRPGVTAVTASAFALVVLMLTLMLGYLNGFERLLLGSCQPGNVMLISEGAFDEVFSNLSADDVAVESYPAVLRDSRGRPMCSRETYVVVNQPLDLDSAGGDASRPVQVRGVEDPSMAAEVHGLGLQPGGHWFSAAGVEEADSSGREPLLQVILGDRASRELGAGSKRSRLNIGDAFELGPRSCRVVGLFRPAESVFDGEVWAKHALVNGLFGKEDYTSAVVRTRDDSTARSLANDLNGGPNGRGIHAMPEPEYYRGLTETNAKVRDSMLFIAAVMAAGGALGLMNAMFALVSQRAKDIGMLRVLGFARRDILLSFLLESLSIALLGGLGGCALGLALDGLSVAGFLGDGAGGARAASRIVIGGGTLATGLIFALIMGGLGGAAPALSAVSVRPEASLR